MSTLDQRTTISLTGILIIVAVAGGGVALGFLVSWLVGGLVLSIGLNVGQFFAWRRATRR